MKEYVVYYGGPPRTSSGMHFHSLEEFRAWEGKEVTLLLTDLETREQFLATVVLSADPEKLPGADRLWLVSEAASAAPFYDFDVARKGPCWAVKILSRVWDEEVTRVTLPAKARPGSLIQSLLRQKAQREQEGKS